MNSLDSEARGYFPPHKGGKSGFEKLFPPHFAGPWGGNRGLFPPHSADPGGEIEVISPPYAGKSGPPQAEILRIWGFEILDFLYKNVFWGPKILKKFRLRRAIRMLSFLYKMYFRDQNPTKFPPAAGYFLTRINKFAHAPRVNRFANSRSAFCAS